MDRANVNFGAPRDSRVPRDCFSWADKAALFNKVWHDFWHHICRLLNASEVYRPLFSLVSPWCGCPDLLVSSELSYRVDMLEQFIYTCLYIYIIILYIESLKIIH